jgi:hypothetical protein
MYSVTFRTADRSRSRKYQTETRALKSIWKWLKENSGSAVFFAPGEEPQVYNDWRELPFEEPKETDFYSSAKWLQLRFRAFDKYGNKCSCCGASPKTGAKLHVDHIKPH